MSGVQPITSTDEWERVLGSGIASVIMFSADWVGPGKIMRDVFEKLTEEFVDVDFYTVDVDKHEAIAKEAGIRAMPSFVTYKYGEKVDTVIGPNPLALKTLINQAVGH
ncbi:thioredoxin [Streptomyces gulbargensis]|uniref:Thioredoxin n=1 Tax=Streptomyces gulbargensis TaxID=364901 RepID=A0ABP7LN87_9ACTN